MGQCEAQCIAKECSYYTWTKWNLNCAISFGNVQQSDAFVVGDFQICGINTAAPPKPKYQQRKGKFSYHNLFN